MCEQSTDDAVWASSLRDKAARPVARRSILRAAAGAGLAGAVAGAAGLLDGASAYAEAGNANDAGGADRIVMLGVNGGPLLLPPAFQPAIALVVSGRIYLVDCGGDAARQLTRAGLGFGNLRNVFLTHRHLDHTAGLPALRLLGWCYAPSPLAALDVWGPPKTTELVGQLGAAFREEVSLFEEIALGSQIPVVGHDLGYPAARNGIYRVMEDEAVTVDLTRVHHGPEVPYAYAYRFTVKSTGKRIVFSGDTAAPDANLIALAQDADVLVHEVMDFDAMESIIESLPPAQGTALREHLLNSHSKVTDVPAVAQAAGVRMLVMCHYSPAWVPPGVYLAKAQAAAGAIGYSGTIIAPADLQTVTL
jgi:ribonuclease BN (tRNA processing enzyme)